MHFCEAVADGCRSPEASKLCRSPIFSILSALKCAGYPHSQLGQLSSVSQMFEENGVKLRT